MNREQKAAQIAELVERLGESSAIFAIDYKGMSVPKAAELRVKLSDSDASFKVVKNRLAKRAADKAGTSGLDGLLVGPVALTLIRGDAVLAAKTLSTFSRENELLEFKGGVMDGEPIDADRFKALASLPGVEVMRGQLVGLAASPLTGLVRGLGGLVSGLAIALGQIAEQGLVGGGENGAAPEAETEPETPEPDAGGEAPEAEAEGGAADAEVDGEAAAEAPNSEADGDAAEAEADSAASAEAPEAEADAPDAEATQDADSPDADATDAPEAEAAETSS